MPSESTPFQNPYKIDHESRPPALEGLARGAGVAAVVAAAGLGGGVAHADPLDSFGSDDGFGFSGGGDLFAPSGPSDFSSGSDVFLDPDSSLGILPDTSTLPSTLFDPPPAEPVSVVPDFSPLPVDLAVPDEVLPPVDTIVVEPEQSQLPTTGSETVVEVPASTGGTDVSTVGAEVVVTPLDAVAGEVVEGQGLLDAVDGGVVGSTDVPTTVAVDAALGLASTDEGSVDPVEGLVDPAGGGSTGSGGSGVGGSGDGVIDPSGPEVEFVVSDEVVVAPLDAVAGEVVEGQGLLDVVDTGVVGSTDVPTTVAVDAALGLTAPDEGSAGSVQGQAVAPVTSDGGGSDGASTELQDPVGLPDPEVEFVVSDEVVVTPLDAVAGEVVEGQDVLDVVDTGVVGSTDVPTTVAVDAALGLASPDEGSAGDGSTGGETSTDNGSASGDRDEASGNGTAELEFGFGDASFDVGPDVATNLVDAGAFLDAEEYSIADEVLMSGSTNSVDAGAFLDAAQYSVSDEVTVPAYTEGPGDRLVPVVEPSVAEGGVRYGLADGISLTEYQPSDTDTNGGDDLGSGDITVGTAPLAAGTLDAATGSSEGDDQEFFTAPGDTGGTGGSVVGADAASTADQGAAGQNPPEGTFTISNQPSGSGSQPPQAPDPYDYEDEESWRAATEEYNSAYDSWADSQQAQTGQAQTGQAQTGQAQTGQAPDFARAEQLLEQAQQWRSGQPVPDLRDLTPEQFGWVANRMAQLPRANYQVDVDQLGRLTAERSLDNARQAPGFNAAFAAGGLAGVLALGPAVGFGAYNLINSNAQFNVGAGNNVRQAQVQDDNAQQRVVTGAQNSQATAQAQDNNFQQRTVTGAQNSQATAQTQDNNAQSRFDAAERNAADRFNTAEGNAAERAAAQQRNTVISSYQSYTQDVTGRLPQATVNRTTVDVNGARVTLFDRDRYLPPEEFAETVRTNFPRLVNPPEGVPGARPLSDQDLVRLAEDYYRLNPTVRPEPAGSGAPSALPNQSRPADLLPLPTPQRQPTPTTPQIQPLPTPIVPRTQPIPSPDVPPQQQLPQPNRQPSGFPGPTSPQSSSPDSGGVTVAVDRPNGDRQGPVADGGPTVASAPSGSQGGVTIVPEVQPPSLEDNRRASGADGGFNDGPRPTLPELNRPQPQSRERFDPNRINEPGPPVTIPELTGYPTGDQELEEILNPNGRPGTAFPPERETDRLPQRPGVSTTTVATGSPTGGRQGPTATASPVLTGDRGASQNGFREGAGDTGTTPVGAITSPVVQPAPTGPVTYAPLPDGRQGVVVGGEQFTGTGNSRDTAGNIVVVQDQQSGQRFASVQPTRVVNGDGTETVFIPRVSGNRVGYNPTGRTAAVYEVPAGESGQIGAGTQVDQVRVRTQPGTTLQFNGGGGSATPGMAFRDPVYDNPVEEEWTIFPASSLDYTTGVRRYSAQVPAGYEDRVDLAQSGTIRIRVPAGSRPVAVTRSVQAFTPYVPTPLPVSTPSLSGRPVYTPSEAPPATIDPTPTSRPTPTRPRSTQSTPAPSGNGLLQRAGDAWNDQPVTVRDLPDRTVEVAFPDARAVYDRSGNKLRGDANAPNRVNPLQIATPGQALEELGNIIQNIPPIPIPGWDPGGQLAF